MSRPSQRVLMFQAAILIITAHFCWYSGNADLGLVGPDEPRFAAIALEMSQSSDWVTPRLHGKPWFEKPILYYWSAGAAFKFFGANEFAARLPSILAATLASSVLVWAAFRFYDWAMLDVLSAMAVASVAFIGFARAATTDMLFSASLTIAMCFAAAMFFRPAHSFLEPGTSRRWPLLFGVALGMAALAKGPAAVLLAGGSIGLWIVLTRRWRDALRAMNPLGILTFAVVAVPWYVLCALRNPEFFDVFFVSHNVERFLTPVFRHEQPFWFFGPVLLLGLLPWSALLVLPLSDAVRLWRKRNESDWRNSPAVFVACWAIFPVVFFSLSKSKLPGYVLPAIPPLIFLMARSVSRQVIAKQSIYRGALCAVGITFIVLALSAGYWVGRLPQESPVDAGSVKLLVLIVGSLGAGIAVLGSYGRLHATLLSSALLIAGIVATFHLAFIPRLDPALSSRTDAGIVQAELKEQPFVVRLHRARHYGLNFYLRRELPEWSANSPADALILADDDRIQTFLEEGYIVDVVKRLSERVILVRVRVRAAAVNQRPGSAGML